MAEQLATKLSESVDNNFKCQFCLEIFEDLRVLACQHSFCTRCEERVIKKLKVDEKYTIKCPTCAIITEVSEGQVQKSNLSILRSEVALHQDTETKVSVFTILCDDCTSDDPAVVRCITCCLYLCEICSHSHNRRKLTSNHKLVTLEELKSVSPSDLPKPDLCHQHEGEEIRLFCVTCQKTICRECAIVDHKEHKYHFVKDVYTQEKEAVTQLLEETKTKQTLLRDALKGVMEMKSRVQEARTAVTEKINATVNGLIQAVETCRKTLLEQTGEIERGKLIRLEMQKEELEVALSSVTSSVEFTEKVLREGSQVKMLGLKKHMMDRLHESNSEVQVLKPCTDEVISYHVKPSNKQDVLNALGRVSDSRIDPSKCEVKTDGEVYGLKVWKKIKFSILVNDQHGREMFEPTADVSVVIKSPNGQDRTQKLELTNKGDGSYHGVYIPHVPGVHGVFVTINETEISSIPFQWSVKDGVNPNLTTLQMEAGKAGVVYNTLVNQTRDFIVVTRDSKGDQITEDDALINVEIEEPNNLDSKVVPVQDCGDGRYRFNYKPVCVGNYQVSVKVDGNDIRGSPFTWGVEQWHLVDGDSGSLIFSQSDMTIKRRGRRTEKFYCEWNGGWWISALGSCGFTSGCHSWKVKVVSGGMWCSVGVTDCNEENTWYWLNWSKHLVCNGGMTVAEPSNIPIFNPDDVIIVYLDNMTLTIHHLASDETDTFSLEKTTLYPYFRLYENDKLTLLV